MNRRMLIRGALVTLRVVWALLAALGFWSACALGGLVYGDAATYVVRHCHK